MNKSDALAGINHMLERMRASRFWRERLKGCPRSVEAPEDLALFPVLTGEDLRERGRDMVLIPPGQVKRIVTATSGTTGSPKRVYLSRQDLESATDYFEWGLRSFCRRGQRILILYPGKTQWSVGAMLCQAAERMGLMPDLPDSPMLEDVLEGLTRGKWDVLAGTPAQMASLAVSLPPLPPGEKRLESALSSGRVLTASVRRRFACATGARIYDHWGCREGGYGGALECSFHCGLHLRPGIWAEAAENEDLLITTYGCRSMPLLRYKTGDKARMETSPCGCQNPSPRIFPIGRAGEAGDDLLKWEPSLEGWGKKAPGS